MSWINCVSVDFVCLQETHSVSESEFADWFSTTNLDINNSKKYKSISSRGAVRSSGVAILYLPQYTLEHCRRDTSGRLHSVEFSVCMGPITPEMLRSFLSPSTKPSIPTCRSLFVEILTPYQPFTLTGSDATEHRIGRTIGSRS